jgi:ethanolamine utilization protein EutQ (cupin superfamily)
MQGQAQDWERWTQENTAEFSLEDLQTIRDGLWASIKAGRWPDQEPGWHQDIEDLDLIIAGRLEGSGPFQKGDRVKVIVGPGAGDVGTVTNPDYLGHVMVDLDHHRDLVWCFLPEELEKVS